MNIQLNPAQLSIIKNILQKYPYHFYAFGSRVKMTAKKFSDLDLCYKENIPDSIITKIAGEFEDSDLPFTVDMINWNQCGEAFQKHIAKDLVDFVLD